MTLVRERFAKYGIPCDDLVSDLREVFAQGTAPIPPEADRRAAASFGDESDDDGKETTDDDADSESDEDPATATSVDGVNRSPQPY